MFSVFDGHGGNQVAEFARDNFVKELVANKNFIEENYEAALTETFCKMDELMRTPEGEAQLKTYNKDGDSNGFTGYASMDSLSEIAFCCG